MEPSLLPGDYILVDRFVFGPNLSGIAHRLLPMRAVRRGDVVVARLPAAPRRHLVKRVVGLPGETLEVRRGTVYIDGARLDEPYRTTRPRRRAQRNAAARTPSAAVQDRFGPVTIPPRHYFVLGDNREHSQDSRLWGALPHNSLAGRVVATYWSSVAPEVVALPPSSAAEALRRRTRAAGRFVRGTRWNRVLRPVR